MANEEEKNNTQEQSEEKEFDLNVTVEDAGPCKKKIIVEVSEEQIKSVQDTKYDELKKEAVIPGFRKGRAPLRLLEKRFGTDVGTQVKLQLLAESSEKALKDQELDTLGEPDIDHEKVSLPESGPMKYDFEVEVRPEFDLPKLEGIKVEKPKTEINDDQIDQEIENLRKRGGVWVPKEKGGVAEDDQIVADVVLVTEGSEDQEKHDNTEIFVRETGFAAGVPIENLAKLLKGAKHGDEKKVSVDVPSTFFNEQYRGKKVDVEITVKEIKQLQLAELDEEFLGRFGADNVEDLKDSIRENMASQAEQQAKGQIADQVYAYLRDKTQFDLPADVVADQSMRIMQRQYVNSMMRGLSKEQVEEQLDQLRASSEEQAKDQLKLFFVMDKIAEHLGVEAASEEEINGYIATVAAQRGRRPEKMREELVRDGSLAQFALNVREQKCIEKILESAEIIEKAPSKAKAKKKTTKKKEDKADKKEKPKSKSREETESKRTPKTKKKTKKKEK